MPWDRALYPDDWESLAYQIKQGTNWRCQQCAKACRRPKETIPEFLSRAYAHTRQFDHEIVQHPQRWTLTVAHLNHIPGDCRPDNLRALCAPCHCRMDLKAMGRKKQLKAERNGQLRLAHELSMD